MHTPSTRPSPTDPIGVSCIVPMCSHIDSTEHDLDVIVTEQGLADVRGLAPTERAKLIIDKCAHPDYRPILKDYFDFSLKKCLERGAAHEPHMLDKVFKMHLGLLGDEKTMKIKNWN
ncbi:4587_t:CDS:2 [Diversispora eburnea]|uniref:4587_t:CDS:1 n=1 Tax=Diversispora eburnea TaxID=1213867 RepID=A0A9N9F2B0_9GLOM|nr:4587_t:CDS:2 [Diversispora eburnea]